MAQRVTLNRTDDSILDLLCNFKVRQTFWPAPRSLGGGDPFFCKWAACTTMPSQLGQNIFNITLAPRFPTWPAIGLEKHNLHEAINQSITPLLLSNQGRQCSVGILLAWTPNGLGQEAMTAVWLPSVACQLWLKVVWPEWESTHGSFPGHLYDSWQTLCTLKQTLHSVHLALNPMSS